MTGGKENIGAGGTGDPPNDQQGHGSVLGSAEKHRNAVRAQRAMEMKRMERWIGFMALPDFADMDFYEAKTRIERGSDIMKQLEAVQLQMMAAATADEDPIQVYGNEFMELEERYVSASTRLLRRFVELTPTQTQSVAANTAGTTGTAQVPQQINVQMAPPPNMVQNTWGNFDGSLLKWKEFKERYVAQCHNNKDIDPVYKFSHLKKSLSGTAAAELKGYEVNAENYQAAWEQLNKRYDRKYPLAREYLRNFFSLKAVSTPATNKELRSLANVTMETIRNLQSLGYQVEQWNIILVHVLHGLLNSPLAYEWGLELNKIGDEPTTEQMVEFLDKHSTAAGNQDQPHLPLAISIVNDNVTRISSSNYSSRNSSRASSVSRSNNQQARGTARDDTEKWKYPCGACGGNHKIFYCPEFTVLNLNQRLAVVKKKQLCPLCLQGGHPLSLCRDDKRCNHVRCKSANDIKHNSMLCKYKVDQHVARPAMDQGAVGGHSSRDRKRQPNSGRDD